MTAPNANPKWSDFAKYLRAEHLEGKTLVAKVIDIIPEEMYSQKDKRKIIKPVLYTDQFKIGLPLSEINQATLCRLFGNSTRAAVGHCVLLKPTKRTVGGEEKNPIYIHPAPPPASTGAVSAPPKSPAPIAPAPSAPAPSAPASTASAASVGQGEKETKPTPPPTASTKPPKIQTPHWKETITHIAKTLPNYADRNGQPDSYHILNALQREGWTVINDTNLREVLPALSRRVRDDVKQDAEANAEAVPF